jgi:hypothetical protein
VILSAIPKLNLGHYHFLGPRHDVVELIFEASFAEAILGSPRPHGAELIEQVAPFRSTSGELRRVGMGFVQSPH